MVVTNRATAYPPSQAPPESWGNGHRTGPTGSEASCSAHRAQRSQVDFLIKMTATAKPPTAKALAALGPKGNYTESGRGDFYPGPQEPRNQVRWGRVLSASKMGWVVVAGYTRGRCAPLRGLGCKTWHFGLGGGQPGPGCGSGCSAGLTWRPARGGWDMEAGGSGGDIPAGHRGLGNRIPWCRVPDPAALGRRSRARSMPHQLEASDLPLWDFSSYLQNGTRSRTRVGGRADGG